MRSATDNYEKCEGGSNVTSVREKCEKCEGEL